MSRIWILYLTSMMCLVSMICGVACSSAPVKTIIAGPSIPGLNLSAGYDCPQFGFMRLRQTGQAIRGSYNGVRGNGDQGTVRGKIEGDILWLEWTQPGNIDNAILPKNGKGWLRILKKGTELKGEWGYNDNQGYIAEWTAFRSDFVD
jgi:hypothetical protein